MHKKPFTSPSVIAGNRETNSPASRLSDQEVHVVGAATPPAIGILLRPSDAAEALAISPRKLWELTNCGDIPCIRIGRAVRYDPVDLRNWIEMQKHKKGKRQ